MPVVALSSATPAFAASPPVVPQFTGNWCKHPGNPKYYHNTMRWTNTNATCTVTINLGLMNINGVTRQAYANIDGAQVTNFTLMPNEVLCFHVDAGLYGNSANGTGSLPWTYVIQCPDQDPVSGPGTPVTTTVGADNDLPPCGTGADPGGNPGGDPPHGNLACV